MESYHVVQKLRALFGLKHLIIVVINNFLFRIDTREDKDQDKENSFLLVIPESTNQ